MTDYKYATEWLDCVSKSPPEEHGGFNPDTIEGATVSLREILRLKRENAMMRKWLKRDVRWRKSCGCKDCKEIMSKLPDLFESKRRGSK